MKYVIWDWNGTLFNDVNICIKSMNNILEKYKLPLIKSEDDYRSKFSFPVINFYKRVGFDFDKAPFEQVAKEFIADYQKNSLQCKLNEGVENVLLSLKEKGYKQIILSASKKINLEQQVNQFGIRPYFDDVLGLSDIYAESKIDIIKNWIEEKAIDTSVDNASDGSSDKLMVIGDSYHDLEVAKAIDATCVLYTKGHQEICEAGGKEYLVIGDLGDVANYATTEMF